MFYLNSGVFILPIAVPHPFYVYACNSKTFDVMKALLFVQSSSMLKRTPAFKEFWRAALKLAHKIHGANESGDPPVVVLHGLLGSKRNWDSMCKRIAGLNRRVVAADIRNHGESPHDNDHTYPELAADVGELIDHLSLKQPVLIGHSMGGRTTMALALTQPSKVHSIVVVDISPVSTAGILTAFFPQLIEHMKRVDFKDHQSNVTKARGVARDSLMATGMFDNPVGLQFILMNIGKRYDGKIGWQCNLDALARHFQNIATFPDELKSKQYQGMALFIGGDQSPYIPPTDIDGIRQIFPKAELKYVKGVGHNVHAEDPNSFFQLLSEFLRKK